ncbi:MAG: M56 family metallopeptidase, partial [Oscillospiraceae bacterium]|nr:M56 family metallopeptidase [Oscillospiraceae bacterium]
MNSVLKIVLSLSLSGSLLIVLLLLGKIFLKNRTSRRWQYYIWLVVIARLLLPSTPEVSAVGTLFQRVEQTISQSDSDPAPTLGAYENPTSEFTYEPAESSQANQESNPSTTSAPSIEEISAAAIQRLWLVWLGVALLLLIRKITAYQGFVKYIKAGCVEVADVELLDKLAQVGAQAGVKRPVELCTNNLISSPLLLGFFRPCIVFPTVDLPEADFEYTIRHELTHYKQRDMFYKWLVQFTICVHWFNPLVWWMGREINRSCELA